MKPPPGASISAPSTALEPLKFSPTQIQQGRLHAILSYLIPGFVIVPLRSSKNAFARFHARQALTLWCAALLVAIALSMGLVFLTVLLMAVPISVSIGVLSLLVFLGAGGVAFIGARNAWNGAGQVLPGVGRFCESHISLLIRD